MYVEKKSVHVYKISEYIKKYFMVFLNYIVTFFYIITDIYLICLIKNSLNKNEFLYNYEIDYFIYNDLMISCTLNIIYLMIIYKNMYNDNVILRNKLKLINNDEIILYRFLFLSILKSFYSIYSNKMLIVFETEIFNIDNYKINNIKLYIQIIYFFNLIPLLQTIFVVILLIFFGTFNIFFNILLYLIDKIFKTKKITIIQSDFIEIDKIV